MKKISEMTLKEKIGQLVFAGFCGLEYDDKTRTLIEDYKLGNVILFARNCNNLRQIHDLNYKLHQEINKHTGIMPFISIDQEGGMVTRIMKEATFCPGNMTIAATQSDNAYKIGKIAGEELRALGINMNLAPSLDVNNNPLNPVIGVRSYSDSPEKVTEYGLKYIRGLQESGIIATAKHFPGHGDTSSDSHYSLPVIPHSKERLNQIELFPFKKAIADGVKAIMSAHVFFTAYENESLPATLSKKVMTDLLRNELGFQGLIVSDCMEMKAIDDNYTAMRGSLMGLLAGLDMVFVSQTYEKQAETLRLIEEAVLNGSFPMALLDEKVARVLKYKEQVYPYMAEHFFNRNFEEKRLILMNPKSKELTARIVDASLTKVKGKDYYPNKRTLLIATEPFASTIAEDKVSERSITEAVKAENLPVDTVKIRLNPEEAEIEDIVKMAKQYPEVVICTYNARFYQNQAKLVRMLHYAVEDLFVLSTRNPYDILSFRQIANYLCVYEYTPNSVKTIVRYLKRELLPVGKMPVKLEEKIQIGASVYVGLKDYPLNKNLEYIDMLAETGVQSVFISAHIPEMNEDFRRELSQVMGKCKEKNIKVILDVSKPMMETFEIPDIYSLRLDYGFSDDDIVRLYRQNRFLIELNASTVDQNLLERLIFKGIDLARIRISHNFYPKQGSGLSAEEVYRRNQKFKEYGLKIMAYIPSQHQKRPPMYDGLPTIEEHRHLPLEAVLSEMKMLGVDEIFFGDSFASKDEIQKAITFDFSVYQIPITVKSDLFESERKQLSLLHRNRLDQPATCIRSSSRIKEGIIDAHHNEFRKFGDITIDNSGFKRYQGEVSILLADQGKDNRTNVIGHAVCGKYLIEHIKPGDQFRFVIVGKNE